MTTSTLWSLAIASLIWGATAQSAVFTFTNGNSNGLYTDPLNWDLGSVPGAADRAVIPSGYTCDLTVNKTIDTIDVTGLLYIKAVILTLENNNDNIGPSGADQSKIDGTVELAVDGGYGELHFTSASHDLNGTGKVLGDHVNCIIFVSHGFTLTNNLATTNQGIRGSLSMTSSYTLSPTPGLFINAGIVESTSQINLDSVLFPYDTNSAKWNTSGSTCAKIVFNHGAWFLGNFNSDPAGGASFVCNAEISTCGTWTENDGGISISGAGSFFKYRYWSAGAGASHCTTNPGSATTITACSGADGYMIDSTFSCLVDPCGG